MTLPRQSLRRMAILLTCAALFQPGNLAAELVAARHLEGLAHGFLVLHSMDGEHLADGELIQNVRGGRVTMQLVFHFRDGSLHDETAVYSQRGSFRLLSYHLVQKGPAFKTQLEVSFDTSSGRVSVRYSEENGESKTINERPKLPPDVANGMILALLKNIRPETQPTTVSMLAATPKPRVVKLQIAPQDEEAFTTGSTRRKATHFVVKVELGGITKLVAPLLGKQPADTHVWILQGQAPAFVKFEGQLWIGGPIWRIELSSPAWPKTAGEEKPSEEKKE